MTRWHKLIVLGSGQNWFMLSFYNYLCSLTWKHQSLPCDFYKALNRATFQAPTNYRWMDSSRETKNHITWSLYKKHIVFKKYLNATTESTTLWQGYNFPVVKSTAETLRRYKNIKKIQYLSRCLFKCCNHLQNWCTFPCSQVVHFTTYERQQQGPILSDFHDIY